ncbi:hypothetical protein G7076_02145 [Sphingomonas sp. HDW15A]|uniref:hypothetical protein n=1 Tax=Sphingomonas sp. HDW15A TaxID=2714942 RepID=UPI00140E5783|nr:hypothetical protein [Sphingomonas sp. HDW15A]QIK95078.1 hypothetical protein G7076_02145 [Sphingomonas sp. HDW15A]
MRTRIIGLAALFAVAACDSAGDENIMIDNQVNAAEAANADVEVLPADETASLPAGNEATPSANGSGNETAPPDSGVAAVIPAQYRGRWGMVPGDCTSTRGDAKGLITVGDKIIRFYESTATLKEQRPAIATSFSGLFGFTGEGQMWETVMTFTRTGDTLKRAEDEGTFTYKRCA